MQKNNIVVFGGGTAGWLTALSMQNNFPEKNITLVQSKEIGTVGVGEATTPHLPNFLESLGIDVMEVLKFTKGTVKNGISFENWNGDGKEYFHQFEEKIANFSIPNLFDSGCDNQYKQILIKNNLNMDEYLYSPKISYKNKVDLEGTAWALHFDASLLAEYMEKVGRERGITVVEGKYNGVTTDDREFITSIEMEDGPSISCDFIFDCSGFHRELIGKHFKQKWISYSDYLPMKCAIPFWLDPEEDIQPYTTTTAMKYGWMWKIPLQHRIGAGYVFDSDYISPDEALQEAQEFYTGLGYEKILKANKVIKFDAGRMDKFWVKNCVAVGLSSSFIEPLEATSLFVTVGQLTTLKHYINEFDNPRERSIKTFNNLMQNTLEGILHFVYFHYITKRQDSKFWQEFAEKNPTPPGFVEKLQAIKEANLRHPDINAWGSVAGFEISSYLQVGAGLKIFEQDMCVDGFKSITPGPSEYRRIINTRAANKSQKHAEFLNNL